MSLTSAARQAREHADTCLDPGCHAVANALEAAVAAAAREQLSELAPEPDTTGLPTPEESGYVSIVWEMRGGVEN